MIRPVSSEQRAPLHNRIDLKTVNPCLRTIPDLEVIPNQWMPVRPVGVEATRIILAIIAQHLMLHVMGVERQAIMEKYVETMTDVTLTSFVTGISLARVPNLVGRKMLGNVSGFMTK